MKVACLPREAALARVSAEATLPALSCFRLQDFALRFWTEIDCRRLVGIAVVSKKRDIARGAFPSLETRADRARPACLLVSLALALGLGSIGRLGATLTTLFRAIQANTPHELPTFSWRPLNLRIQATKI